MGMPDKGHKRVGELYETVDRYVESARNSVFLELTYHSGNGFFVWQCHHASSTSIYSKTNPVPEVPSPGFIPDPGKSSKHSKKLVYF